MSDVERHDNKLNSRRDPQNHVGCVPERRGGNFQHVGPFAGGDELASIDPELPRHQAENKDAENQGAPQTPALPVYDFLALRLSS